MKHALGNGASTHLQNPLHILAWLKLFSGRIEITRKNVNVKTITLLFLF